MKIFQLATSYPASETDATAPFVRSMAYALADMGHSVVLHVPLHPAAIGNVQRYLGPTKGYVDVSWIRYTPNKSLNTIGHGRSLQGDQKLNPTVLLAVPLYVIASLIRGYILIKLWKPDVIQAHWVVVPGVIAAMLSFLTGTPLIINLHGSDIFLAKKSRMIGALARFGFRRAAAVSACSPYLRDSAVQMGARNVHVIPHGADPLRFPAKTRYDENPRIILSLGRLVQKKGLDVLLRAAPRILGEIPDVEIWIAGDGPELQRLKTMAGQSNESMRKRLKFLGSVAWTNVPALLRQATVFVVPSIRDGSGNEDGLPTTILEAMASGLPIVASDIAGVSLVVKDGINGLLVPPGDVTALGNAVNRILSDNNLKLSMGSAGRESVENNFSWIHSARLHLELINYAVWS